MNLKSHPATIAVFFIVMATAMMTSSMALPRAASSTVDSSEETVLAARGREALEADSFSGVSARRQTRSLHNDLAQAVSGAASSISGDSKSAVRKRRSVITSYNLPVVREGQCQSDMQHFRWCYRCGRVAGDEPSIYHDCCRQVDQVMEFCYQMLY